MTNRSRERPADRHGDYVMYRSRSGYGGVELYISPQLHGALEAERVLVEKAEAAEREERRREQAHAEAGADVEKEPAKPDFAIGKHVSHHHEVAQHKVLVDAGRVSERLRDVRDGIQGDSDHAKREHLLLSRALERGACRSVVRRPDWREALDLLAAELPAFRSAVEVVCNALALSEATGRAPNVPSLLLVGPPGVGKSYFCARLIEALGVNSRWLGMDQPSAGSQLRGSDRAWGNAMHGILYELLALGDTANPVVVLDEIDKAARKQYSQNIDPLGQLYSAIEPQTARRLSDVSLDVEIDASQVVYLATANDLRTFDSALLSRFEVVMVGLPSAEERRESAQRIVERFAAHLEVRFARRALMPSVVVLSDYSPRVILRAMDKAAGAVIASGRRDIALEDIEIALGLVRRVRAPVVH